MKKTILLVICTIVSVAAFSQTSKDSVRAKAISAYKDTAKMMLFDGRVAARLRPKSDTLEVLDVKFIKIGNSLFDVERLKNIVITLTISEINALISAIEEYPAKFANPFTNDLMKRWGLKFEQNPLKQ